jgi:steroid delta-isomerase-like uncharacterized protein
METDGKKLIADLLSAMNSHDTNMAVSLWTDDCIYENWANEIVKHGKKELTTMISAQFADFPDMKFELKSSFAAGDWAGLEYITSGTFANSHEPATPATGKTFSVHTASIIQIRKGKISRLADYFDSATMLRQVGLMPAHPK